MEQDNGASFGPGSRPFGLEPAAQSQPEALIPRAVYDKNGREIMIGDVVKVYHFTSALRRKRHYMYKQVTGERVWQSGSTSLFLSHLGMKDDDGYYVEKNGRVLSDYEIVQSIDARFEERPRCAETTKDHP
jgi:hypothetical protein